MKSITEKELQEKLSSKKDDSFVVVDVREPYEFKSGHIQNSHNVPLEKLVDKKEELLSYEMVYLVCLTGPRSVSAQKKLSEMGVEATSISGGFSSWKSAGNELSSNGKTVLPIMRQVFIAAGALVLFGTILSVAISPYWVFLAMFIGAGLTFSGVTGICGMQMAVSKLPWNNALYIDTLRKRSE